MLLSALISAGLGGLGILAASLGQVKGNPVGAAVGAVGGAIVSLVAKKQISSRWITANANEWLIVVRNGKMVTAGIGLTVFAGLQDVVVTFPSLLQKITFCAEQITKEMQGIRVSGFVVWSIHREGDGPLKAYRYLDGLTASGCEQANDSIARMAESIVRSTVANMTIAEVVQNRDVLRDRVRREMSEVVKGWGVWLETIEVTEVNICSRSLFDDLQVEFRQKSRQTAELLRQGTDKQLEENKITNNSALTRMRVDADVRGEMYAAQQRLVQQQEVSKNEAQLHALRLAQVARDEELQRKKIESEEAAQALRMQRKLEREAAEASQEVELLKCRLLEERNMSSASVQRMVCDTARNIYAKLPLKEMKLVNVTSSGGSGTGGSSAGGLDTLLPGLMGIQMATQQAGEK